MDVVAPVDVARASLRGVHFVSATASVWFLAQTNVENRTKDSIVHQEPRRWEGRTTDTPTLQQRVGKLAHGRRVFVFADAVFIARRQMLACFVAAHHCALFFEF